MVLRVQRLQDQWLGIGKVPPKAEHGAAEFEGDRSTVVGNHVFAGVRWKLQLIQ